MSEARGMIKSMMIIGSAQAVNITISIMRLKVIALMLGPSGIGLLSIYNNLQAMVATTAGLGMGSSGVRQIAVAKGERQTLNRVRRVLLAAHLVQGILAMIGVWLLRTPISVLLFKDPNYAYEVGLIGFSVLLTLLGAAQTTLLQGLRRVGDLGRVTVIGALSGTIAGLAAVWLYAESGLIWFVVVQPLATTLIAFQYTSRLPKSSSPSLRLAEVWEIWKPMAKLGAAFMLGGLATTATLLVVRGRITQELGLDAAGQFAAAWSVTMIYVGFLLAAMASDYLPRLTEVISDRASANRLMNNQTQLGLAIGGPVLLLLIGMAPWAMPLIYSTEFAPAVELLQWQSVGNVFKIASWALGFAFVAAAHGKIFLIIQLNFNFLFLIFAWFGVKSHGISATGPAFLVAYILHFIILTILARAIRGFRWQPLTLVLLAIHISLSLALLTLARNAPQIAAITSVFLSLATGLFGLRTILVKIGTEGVMPTRLSRIYTAIGWPI